uniref:Glycine--tRNA ligase 1, mitochondrial n=1 Tax=Noccaea caerulescens TaxID=107243 RepID=A0A1J3K1Z6_NOCCA
MEATQQSLDQLQSTMSSSRNGSLNRKAFRETVASTLKRRYFYTPSFKIYGSTAGFYDYGPPGEAVESNVLSFWRQHFVLEEDMHVVKCPRVTPEDVLKASGHVDKFTDLSVKDEKTGKHYRADHVLKDYCNETLEKDISAEKAAELKNVLAVLDNLSGEEIGAKIKEYGILLKTPRTHFLILTLLN